MKKISNNIRNIGAAALGLFIMGSCSDILDEQPRSNYDPGFFQTELGISFCHINGRHMDNRFNLTFILNSLCNGKCIITVFTSASTKCNRNKIRP